MVRLARSSGTSDGSTITSTPYMGLGLGSRSGLQGTLGVGTLASGSPVIGASSSGSSSYEDKLVWEERSGKKKPKWLRETLKDALKAGKPSDKVRAIKMPDRLGMVLVACT